MSAVLAVNAGSSSLKYSLFGTGEPPPRLVSGRFERIGRPGGLPDHAACVEPLLLELSGAGQPVGAIGHRIVHGGSRFLEPVRVTPELLAELRRLSPYDPEHLPAQIALLEAFGSRFPGLPQVACFDTSFHRDLPRVSRMLPLPRRYEAAGIRRYGFHGISYEFIVGTLRREPGGIPRLLVIAHLGNGASLAAVKDGKSIDTTMAFTPAAGIPMSTRSGDLDPGLVAYLARLEGMSPDGFQALVTRESGLLGISETSPDVRDLLARERQDIRAAEALALFSYRVKQTVGAYAAALGGLDSLVFSGGIGEHAAEIRERICTGMEFLGIELDPARNARHEPVISKEGSRAAVRIVKTDEEIQIARSTRELAQR